uniref:At1g61320/AtMIF1 LRR domain-containing protein n=1 Tax=Triticum aestivum TaxID=4565 RepID=A0A3B6TS48_WHEAT
MCKLKYLLMNRLPGLYLHILVFLPCSFLKLDFNVILFVLVMSQLQKLAPRPCGMFMHLRHMTCGLTVLSLKKPNSDNGVLQLVHCLNVAPQLQTLHLDMIYSYFKASAPDEAPEEEGPHMHRHDHLKTVHISGFRCYKAQVELACCILENARVLDHMEVQPRVAVAICGYADLKNFAVERRFLPGVREWARLTSERFGKAITVLDAPSE